MANPFDFETALNQLQSGQTLTGENGILTPLIKKKIKSIASEINCYNRSVFI